ncbi:MAG: hypothetical protein KGL39_44220 [Patescibacteria group bacterium]|nr:hypothetical protein [Patescibacteria group bacterium]
MTREISKTDLWKTATETDKLQALIAMANLPSRQSMSADIDRATYFIALDGVTCHALSGAVRAILQGALGHAFFPSPPELRIECNKVHAEVMRERERQYRLELQAKEAARFRPVVHDPQSQARVADIHARFLQAIGHVERSSEAAEIRARYGDLLDQIPDRKTGFSKFSAKG